MLESSEKYRSRGRQREWVQITAESVIIVYIINYSLFIRWEKYFSFLVEFGRNVSLWLTRDNQKIGRVLPPGTKIIFRFSKAFHQVF